MSKPISSTRNDLAEQYTAHKATRDEIEKQHEREMENLKKSYSIERAASEDRFETSTQAEKLSHYDHLKNQKTQVNRGLARMGYDKRAVITQRPDAYSKAEIKTEQDGSSKRTEMQRVYAAAE